MGLAGLILSGVLNFLLFSNLSSNELTEPGLRFVPLCSVLFLIGLAPPSADLCINVVVSGFWFAVDWFCPHPSANVCKRGSVFVLVCS